MDEPGFIEVVYATVDHQWVVRIELTVDMDVELAIHRSKFKQVFSSAAKNELTAGIFGQACSLKRKLEPGDRVEIYRPLLQHPMEARRQRQKR